MIDIQSKWGAMYLVTDESYIVDPVTLVSETGVTLTPGEQINQIGKIKRTSFELRDGFTMQYEGLLKVGNVTYAIFKSSGFDTEPGKIEGQIITYRYAFAVVLIRGVLACFYVGKDNFGCDIKLDFKR